MQSSVQPTLKVPKRRAFTRSPGLRIGASIAVCAALVWQCAWLILDLVRAKGAQPLALWFFMLSVLILLLAAGARSIPSALHRRRAVDAPLMALALLALSLLFYVPTSYRFGLDEAQYLFMSIRLFHGLPPLDVSGNASVYRIGYVAYFGLMYLLGGLTGASLAPFVALACFVTLLFVVGRSLFGTATAAFTCGLYLLTPRERHLTAQLIDGANAFTMLAAFGLLNARRRGDEGRYGAALALAVFGAFLVKETALLFAPLLLIRCLCRMENAGFRRTASFYLSLSVLMGAYLAVHRLLPAPPSYFRSDDLALQTLPILSEGGSWFERIGTTAMNMARGFAEYFHSRDHASSLDRFAWIAVLFPIGLARSAVGAARGRLADRNVLTALLCFVPLISAVGWIDWRPEHCLTAIGLLYLLLARAIVELAELCTFRRSATLLAFAACGLSLLRQDVHGANLTSSDRDQLNGLIHGAAPGLDVSLFGDPPLTEVLASTVSPGGRVWSSPALPGLSASIRSGERFWTAPVPTHVLGMPGFTSGFNKSGPSAIRGPIWGIFGPPAASPDEPLFLIYRRDLEEGREKVGAFVDSPAALNGYRPILAMLNGTVTRPEVVQLDKDFGPTWISAWDADRFTQNIGLSFVHETALRQLDLLRRSFPERYRWYSDKLREGGVPMAEADLADLLQGRSVSGLRPVRDADPEIPPQPYALGTRVDFTAKGGDRYASTGWSAPEAAGTWTDGPRARLTFRLKPVSSDLLLTASYLPYLPPNQPPPVVTVVVAGTPVAVWTAAAAREATRCALIPARLVGSDGDLGVTLDIAAPPSPSELHWVDDPRHLGILVEAVTLDEAARSRACAP